MCGVKIESKYDKDLLITILQSFEIHHFIFCLFLSLSLYLSLFSPLCGYLTLYCFNRVILTGCNFIGAIRHHFINQGYIIYIPYFIPYLILGLGALSGLMLDLGLLKISYGDVFHYFQPLREALTLKGPFLIIFLTMQGKANL